MASRVEFSTKTRAQAFERAFGRCEWVEDGIRSHGAPMIARMYQEDI